MINVKIWQNTKPQLLSIFRGSKNDKSPILFTLVGIAGVGKSSIAERISIKDEDTDTVSKPIVYASDNFRKEMYGDVIDQKHNEEVFKQLHRCIIDTLSEGEDVVYDATNLCKKRRRHFLQCELRGVDCHKVCVCVLAPMETIFKQNGNRERKVPNSALKRMYLSFEPPSLEEGFDQIILIDNYDDEIRKKYTLENFFTGDIDAVHIDQENKHHELTIGKHCIAAYEYIRKWYKNDDVLAYSALMHDIGKVATKSHLNSKGKDDGNCHYYNHWNCGSYDSFFYTRNLNLCDADRLHIANLIYYHMRPFVWEQSENAKNRDLRSIGIDFAEEIMKLHEADLHAR